MNVQFGEALLAIERYCCVTLYSHDRCYMINTNQIDEYFATSFRIFVDNLASSILHQRDKQRLKLLLAFTTELNDFQFDYALSISIACMLVRWGIESRISIFNLLKGFKIGLKYIVDRLLNSNSDVIALVDLSAEWEARNVILSTLYHRSRLTHIDLLNCSKGMVTSIYKAFRSNNDTFWMDDERSVHRSVVYQDVAGASTSESLLSFSCSAVMDMHIDALSIASIKEISRGLVVAVFECSLEVLSLFYHSNIGTSCSSNGSDDKMQLERRWLQYFAEVLHKSSVTCVICQKKIHPYLIRLLNSRNILTLERASKKHIGLILRLSGACLQGEGLLQSWKQSIDASSFSTSTLSTDREEALVINVRLLGYLESLNQRSIMSRTFIIAKGHPLAGQDVPSLHHFECTLFSYDLHPSFDLSAYARGVVDRWRPCCSVVIGAPTAADCAVLRRSCAVALRELQMYKQCSRGLQMMFKPEPDCCVAANASIVRIIENPNPDGSSSTVQAAADIFYSVLATHNIPSSKLLGDIPHRLLAQQTINGFKRKVDHIVNISVISRILHIAVSSACSILETDGEVFAEYGTS